MAARPLAEPFVADAAVRRLTDGQRIGVLLSHGFTGSPGSMRPWAEHLAGRGYAVVGARACPATAPPGRS